jgi:hypothetical protein
MIDPLLPFIKSFIAVPALSSGRSAVDGFCIFSRQRVVVSLFNQLDACE